MNKSSHLTFTPYFYEQIFTSYFHTFLSRKNLHILLSHLKFMNKSSHLTITPYIYEQIFTSYFHTLFLWTNLYILLSHLTFMNKFSHPTFTPYFYEQMFTPYFFWCALAKLCCDISSNYWHGSVVIASNLKWVDWLLVVSSNPVKALVVSLSKLFLIAHYLVLVSYRRWFRQI